VRASLFFTGYATPMNLYVGSIVLTVAANAAYHLLNKSIAPGAHPFASLVATYGTGLLLSVTVLAVSGPQGGAGGLKELNWASYALGAVVVLLEAGFLLAYRAGWKISVAAVYSNVAVGLLLLPIGYLLYRETLTPVNLVGVGLAVIALVLMSR
jgi:drug/metabolite transporter (DMT)-like permease